MQERLSSAALATLVRKIKVHGNELIVKFLWLSDMNTFILYWNPQISNFKDEERTDFVRQLRDGADYEFNMGLETG